MGPPFSKAKLVQITSNNYGLWYINNCTITMVHDMQITNNNYIQWGESKPTYNHIGLGYIWEPIIYGNLFPIGKSHWIWGSYAWDIWKPPYISIDPKQGTPARYGCSPGRVSLISAVAVFCCTGAKRCGSTGRNTNINDGIDLKYHGNIMIISVLTMGYIYIQCSVYHCSMGSSLVVPEG